MSYTPTEGTVIKGTMKMIDLVPAFYDELKRVGAAPFTLQILEGDVEFARYLRDTDGDDNTWVDTLDNEDPGSAEWVLERLTTMLEEHAPPGLYFGPHQGASLDYGWWPVDD